MTTIENAYAQFAEERFPLPSEERLVELERELGVRLPEEYRKYILKFNGGFFAEPDITPIGEGCPLEPLEAMFGIGASHPIAELGLPYRTELFDDNNPPKALPIGRTSMGGLIVLDTAPGDGNGAVFLKQAWGDFYYLVADIEAFFGLLRPSTVE